MGVEVDTHVCGMLEFESGVVGSLMMSFDIWDSMLPRLEIYGELGTLCMPDPDPTDGTNIFGGQLLYKTRQTSRWSHRPRPLNREAWDVAVNNHGYNEDSRGLGLAALAYAVRDKRPLRASGKMAFHVFDIMMGILDSPHTGVYNVLEITGDRPAPLPENFPVSEG